MISNSRLPLPNKKKEHVYFETKNTSFRNKHVPFLIKIQNYFNGFMALEISGDMGEENGFKD
jgi:hypothetical protein